MNGRLLGNPRPPYSVLAAFGCHWLRERGQLACGHQQSSDHLIPLHMPFMDSALARTDSIRYLWPTPQPCLPCVVLTLLSAGGWAPSRQQRKLHVLMMLLPGRFVAHKLGATFLQTVRTSHCPLRQQRMVNHALIGAASTVNMHFLASVFAMKLNICLRSWFDILE